MAKKMSNLEVLVKAQQLHLKYLGMVNANRRLRAIHLSKHTEESQKNFSDSLERSGKAWDALKSFLRRHRVVWDEHQNVFTRFGEGVHVYSCIEEKEEEIYELYKMSCEYAQDAYEVHYRCGSEEDRIYWCECKDDCDKLYKDYVNFCQAHCLNPRKKLPTSIEVFY